MSRASATASAHSGPVTCQVPRPIRGTGVPWTRQVYGVLGDVPELLGLGEALKLLEGLVLDLADALARDVERAPDLVERARVLAAEAVAELEDAALAVGEVLQRLAQRLLGEDLGGALVGRLGALVGDELAELRLLLVAHRLLEADRGLRGALDRVDLLGVDPGDLGDLIRGGLAAELGDQLALGAADLVELLDDVDGDADRPRLVGQRASDGLADPPRRVGGELEALAVVELLRRAHEAERPLLDEVEEGQALVAVVLGDRDDQAQVGLDHLLLGVEVAALDALGEVDLLLRGEQPDLADVLEEQLQRVGRHVRPQVQRGLLGPAAALVGRALHLLARCDRRIDLLDQLDLLGLEEGGELLHVRLVEVELRRGLLDLGVGEHAELLTLGQKALDLFEFLQLYD